jgi:hypothetical protein
VRAVVYWSRELVAYGMTRNPRSLVFMIEAQIEYTIGALRAMDGRRAATVEVRREPFRTYNDDIQTKMRGTVWNSGGCASWYFDAEGRNTTLWPDFTWKFRQRTRRFDAEHYQFGAHATPVAAPSERVEVAS